jgi:hypothetical protein
MNAPLPPPFPAEASAGSVPVAALIYLLSSCVTTGCGRAKARIVLQHLELIAGCDTADPLLRSTCLQLLPHWRCKAVATPIAFPADASRSRMQ